MAGLIPQSFIDDLLARLDIVEVVDSRVKLKRAGKNYSACCPFHDEKTPSFTVSPDKQFYYCFGCGASGTALNFVLEYDRVDFPTAIEQLAATVGLTVPKEQNERESQRAKELKELFQLMEKARQFYVDQLRQNDKRMECVNYLRQRGLDGRIAKDFSLGFAPPGWNNLLDTLGAEKSPAQRLKTAGMVVENPDKGTSYDRFRHRVMFPIRDTRGRVIGFGGRVLDDSKPKYLNSPETPIFHKGRELYGLYEVLQDLRQPTRLLVVEGYMDVVALAQFGIRYAVATLGTACTPEHLQLAFRHTQEVIFCFDGDKAGRNAALRALESALPAMEDGRQVKFLFLPEGEDPDTLIRQVGATKFNHMLDLALPLEEFIFDASSEGIDLRTMEGRARFSKKVAPLLHRLPKGIFRELMYDNLAKRTDVPRETLQELIDSEPEPTPPAPRLTTQPQASTSRSERDVPPPPPQEMPEPGEGPQYLDAPPPYDEAPLEDVSWDDDMAAYYDDMPPSGHPPEIAGQAQEIAYQPRQTAIKMPASQLIIALLLQHPELAESTPELPEIEASQHPDLQLFVTLLQLLKDRPGYTLSKILGFWRARYGSESTEKLANLAASDLLHNSRLHPDCDMAGEYHNCLQRLEKQMIDQRKREQLARLSQKRFQDLSDEEKQLIRELHLNQGSR